MADFGDTEPLLEHNDDNEEEDTTTAFQPDENPTPGP